MPSTHEEVIEASDAVTAGQASKWFTVFEQPESRIRTGDWRPCQFLDPELTRAAMRLEMDAGLIRLQDRYPLGPAGQAVRGAFRPDGDNESGYRVFWGRSMKLRTMMEAEPEQAVIDKKPGAADRCREQAGHLLLAARFDTISGKLLAIFCKKPALGSMWVPVQANEMSAVEAKALCAWFNSTLGALGFMFNRSTKLTNPSFSQEALGGFRIPDLKKAGVDQLVRAYEQTKRLPVQAWKHAAGDEMRDRLDQAAAAAAEIELAMVRNWRRRLAAEPTISNEKATVADPCQAGSR